jgi:hypothetical protein
MERLSTAKRTGMRQGLQAKRPSNRWGIALQVCAVEAVYSSDFAHLEPTKGGLI